MEATGVDHLPLVSRFKEAGFFVSIINSLVVKYVSAAWHRGKMDKLDAVHIPHSGLDNWFKLDCALLL